MCVCVRACVCVCVIVHVRGGHGFCVLQSVASSAGLAVDFPGSRYQWREYYLMCFSGPHYAACGRRRMSSSARHKQRFVLPG